MPQERPAIKHGGGSLSERYFFIKVLRDSSERTNLNNDYSSGSDLIQFVVPNNFWVTFRAIVVIVEGLDLFYNSYTSEGALANGIQFRLRSDQGDAEIDSGVFGIKTLSEWAIWGDSQLNRGRNNPDEDFFSVKIPGGIEFKPNWFIEFILNDDFTTLDRHAIILSGDYRFDTNLVNREADWPYRGI